ncbi:MAG: hypothetical protein R6V54_02565 [Desulfobacteraceae bacterium]
MIDRKTVTTLNLKPLTQNGCYRLFVRINSEFKTRSDLEEAISWWQDDPEKLNHLWWVLNYYFEKFDSDRRLKACIENQLDLLARQKNVSTEEP